METINDSSQFYKTAKDFWEWWQVDPDSDFMISDPKGVIKRTLERHGAHPIQAAYLSKIALESTCDTDLKAS